MHPLTNNNNNRLKRKGGIIYVARVSSNVVVCFKEQNIYMFFFDPCN